MPLSLPPPRFTTPFSSCPTALNILFLNPQQPTTATAGAIAGHCHPYPFLHHAVIAITALYHRTAPLPAAATPIHPCTITTTHSSHRACRCWLPPSLHYATTAITALHHHTSPLSAAAIPIHPRTALIHFLPAVATPIHPCTALIHSLLADPSLHLRKIS